MAAAATASTPVKRITMGGEGVMRTRSLLPSASRHSRAQTARTTVARSGVAASTLIWGIRRSPIALIWKSPGGRAPIVSLHDPQVDVLERRSALGHVQDLRTGVHERPYEQRIRSQRVGRRDDDRAVLEARLAYAGDGLHSREILRARRGEKPDLGGATVELGAQLVEGRDADDTL